jgi:CheY-like chemotaxis protein
MDIPAPSYKVLLIDDDKFLIDLYSLKFSNQGFEVHAAQSVKAGIEALKGGFSPDAVVFDLVMPERTGFSLLESLRDEKLAPGAVRVALTNESDDTERKRAEELGADKYIVKATMIPSEVVSAVTEEIKLHKKK